MYASHTRVLLIHVTDGYLNYPPLIPEEGQQPKSGP